MMWGIQIFTLERLIVRKEKHDRHNSAAVLLTLYFIAKKRYNYISMIIFFSNT
jgi:hypothetical protein